MAKPDWIRWYPAKWLSGTFGLTNEQRGVYIQVINVILDRGECPVDYRYLGRLCNLRSHCVKRVVGELVEAGKLLETGSKLHQNRAETELKLARNLSERGSLGAAKRWKSNDLDHASGTSQPQPQPQPQPQEGLIRSVEAQKTDSESDLTRSRASADPYAFEGQVIRLNQQDFDRWRRAYHSLDLQAELTALDDFYAELPAKERGKWFVRASAALAKKHEARAAERSPPKPRLITEADHDAELVRRGLIKPRSQQK